jgi:hypothetical protein
VSVYLRRHVAVRLYRSYRLSDQPAAGARPCGACLPPPLLQVRHVRQGLCVDSRAPGPAALRRWPLSLLLALTGYGLGALSCECVSVCVHVNVCVCARECLCVCENGCVCLCVCLNAPRPLLIHLDSLVPHPWPSQQLSRICLFCALSLFTCFF